VKEQFSRIAGCSFTLKWDGGDVMDVSNTHIVDDATLWRMSSHEWSATVELSERFHQHLRQSLRHKSMAIGSLTARSVIEVLPKFSWPVD
jgi:hypothetical protein